MQISVRDLMTSVSTNVGPETTIAAATDRLVRDAAEAVYVTDAAGRLLGIVPDYELLKSRMSGQSRNEAVATLMTEHVIAVAADSPLAEIAPRFRECRHRSFPVVEGGRLVGCIARHDVLRLRHVLDELETQADDDANIDEPAAETHAVRRPRFLDASTNATALRSEV